jgi:hypothetical protein
MEQLLEQAEAFRAQKPGEDVNPEWTLLTGMKLPKSFQTTYEHPQAPVFTHMIENNFPNLYEDFRMVIYLNAGLPYTDAYPGAESRAGMSFLHLLICPKERIYNIKTLRKTDVNILMYMMNVTEYLFNHGDFKEKVLSAILEQSLTYDENVFGKFSSERRAKLADAIKKIHDMKTNQLSWWFHEHPKHSVGHLHLHCILDTTLTESYELNAPKNVPYCNVVLNLQENRV